MRENQPVCKTRYTRWENAYVITRYEDVTASLRDERIVKEMRNINPVTGGSAGRKEQWAPKAIRPALHSLLLQDGADHKRLRDLARKVFTPAWVSGLEPRLQAITDDLLSKAKTQSKVDLVESLALPLATTVIADIIGVPTEDRGVFFSRARKIMRSPTPLNILKAIPRIVATIRYLRQLTEKRRSDQREDLITALAQAEDNGDRFTEDEALAMLFTVMVAGYESTASVIANGTLALLSNPEQLCLLRQDMSRMENAIEEFLRYDGPLQYAEKSFAREPLSVRGIEIPRGSVVLSALMSANRDQTVFENADRLDITRSPNKHVAFGHGIHFCLGAPLARLEAKVALRSLLERSPNLKLVGERADLRYVDMMKLHRLEKLPVAL